MPRLDEEEEWMPELPELDGGDGEDDPPIEPGVFDDPGLDEGADDPDLDDSAPEDQDFGQNELDEDGPADVGADDEDGPRAVDESLGIEELAEGVLADGDEPGVAEMDFELDGGEERSPTDGGEEGPLDADDELRDEDLPALDADADDEGDDASFFELVQGAAEGLPLPWQAPAWERAGTAVSGTFVSVTCAGSDVVALGASGELFRLDLEGGTLPLGVEGLEGVTPRRLLADGGVPSARLWVEAEEGVFVASDGRSFEPVPELPAFCRRDDAVLADASEALLLRIQGLIQVDAAALGEPSAEEVFFVVSSRSEERSWVIRKQGPAEGVVVEVLTEGRLPPQVRGSTWDSTRGVLWVVGDFGALAYQRRV